MNTNNPKKNKEVRRPRPTYKSVGKKELHVQIEHEGKLVWVKVTSMAGKLITGMIITGKNKGGFILGSEITFDDTEILGAEEVDYIKRGT